MATGGCGLTGPTARGSVMEARVFVSVFATIRLPSTVETRVKEREFWKNRATRNPAHVSTVHEGVSALLGASMCMASMFDTFCKSFITSEIFIADLIRTIDGV